MVIILKKIIYLIILLFLITGCTSDYELKITPNNIEETVNFTLKDNDYDKAILINRIFTISDIYYDDETEMGKHVINLLRTEQFQPTYLAEDFYTKKVEKNKINMSYTYKDDSYEGSNIFNFCFGDTYYDSTDEYYVLNGYNSFKCLLKDKMQFTITTDYRVINSNADKVIGNKYIWNFNRDNNMDHDLYIQISKNYKRKKLNIFPIIIIITIILLIIIYKIFIKDRKYFQKNNEI